MGTRWSVPAKRPESTLRQIVTPTLLSDTPSSAAPLSGTLSPATPSPGRSAGRPPSVGGRTASSRVRPRSRLCRSAKSGMSLMSAGHGGGTSTSTSASQVSADPAGSTPWARVHGAQR